ncbi:hypothetical protein S7711_02983 [Stachybotrys chartarum IBT 7711]|uniref:CHAT domain-containing protein n=1 Tax=Stachybotrys chartarum (strain CBS 109288 / IBT 7711) TaxID=1280523 RepID=A0A084B2I0_STACB|nr:hypothetical protein S7711_02983 [Stachybotrys chartarum IBT 7711]
MDSQVIFTSPVNLAALLDKTHHLQDHGRHKEAVELLRSALGTQTNDAAEIALELGQALQSQGYGAEALKTWEECLGKSSSDHEPDLVNLRMRMNICLLRPMVRDNFEGLSKCLIDARSTYEEFKCLLLDDDTSAHSIHIRSTFCDVLLFASEYHVPQVAPEAFAWLNDTFEACMVRRQYRLALTVARRYVVSVSSQTGRESSGLGLVDWLKMVQRLIHEVSMPCVFKATALDLIAEYAEKSGTLEHRESYERDAILSYEESCHVNGAENVQIRQLSRKCATEEGSLEDNVGRVLTHFKLFEEQGYLWGIARGLHALQSHSDTRYFDFQLTLIQMTDEIVGMSGLKLQTLLIKFKSIAIWLAHSGRAARVIEASLPLYENISQDDARTFKGLLSYIIAQAYLQLGNFETANSWLSRSLALFPPKSGNRADATTCELRIVLLKASSYEELDLDSLLEKWDGVIEQDVRDGFVDSAIDKLDALTGVLTRNKDARRVVCLERIEKLIPRLSASAKLADTKLAAFYQNSAASKISQIEPRQTDTEVEESAIELLEKAVPLYMKHGALVEAGNSRQMQALAHYSVFRKSRDSVRLNTALELTSIALDCFRVLDVTGMVSLAAYWCGFYTYVAWEYGMTTAETSLQQLSVAEEAKNEERVDLVIFGGLDALRRKQRLRGEAKTQEIYDMARRVCIRRDLDKELWQWTQKSKARSLSDLLGLGILVPERLIRDIEENPAAKALFEEENELQQIIKVTEGSDRIHLRNQLHLLQRRMEEHAALKDLMNLRAGNPITYQQLNDLVTQVRREVTETNVVFVDWVFVDGQLFLVSVKNLDQPRVFPCAMTEHTLRAWKETYITRGDETEEGIYTSELEENDPNYCLRQLDALVAPIADFSEEYDLLVLCATGLLHSIPLHALWIDGGPLILRNPVVYCASLTSAWQCWRRALGSCSTAQAPRSKTIMAVYNDEANTRFSATEQACIYGSANSLSVQMQADAVVGEAATMSKFKETIRLSSFFHFHGHCSLNPDDVVEQCVLLADGSVSVLDVFQLQFDTSPHITLIACDSATQSISVNGDEPLGLVTGLLCAGASSVLGTMWPIPSVTGRRFSEHFYDELDQASLTANEPNATGLVDLAGALQAAIIEIRGDARTRRPFHWASFVLHGSPFMRL